MIQRHQRIVFWCLIACIVGMTALLVVERQRSRDRVSRLADQTPLDAPTGPTEPVTMEFANDNDGSLHPGKRDIALPIDATPSTPAPAAAACGLSCSASPRPRTGSSASGRASSRTPRLRRSR